MCEITVTKYVRLDGTRHSVERKKLCDRSDGVNPCYFQTKQELTEFIPPSLDYKGSPSPPSTGGPGTPMTATANYEIREPLPQSSKGKGKAKVYGMTVNTSGKRKNTSRPSSGERVKSRHDSSDDDSNDPIVAVEQGGRIKPVSATTRRSPHGSPLSKHRRAPAIIHQPQPPLRPLDDPFRPSTDDSYHRRVSTAPGPIDFDPDNEIFDRANARDELRRQNRDRQRREEEDRRLAEVLQEEELRKAEDLRKAVADKEAKEKAADEYAMRDFQRLNERDRLREAARRKREAEEDQTDRRTREAQQKALEETRRRKEAQDEARRREDARDRARQSYVPDRSERIIQEDLERRRRERAQASAMHMREIDEEIQRLDHELLSIQERAAARERALQLEKDVREHDRLQDEIRQLEQEHREETAPLPPQYASEISDLEAELQRLNARIRTRELDATASVDDRTYDEPRNVGPAPPLPRGPSMRTPISVQQVNPFLDEEFRRQVGQQVLERERNLALQETTVATTGMSRRNTVSDGPREKHYRKLRSWYPE